MKLHRSHLKGLCNSFPRTSKKDFRSRSLLCGLNFICAWRQKTDELGLGDGERCELRCETEAIILRSHVGIELGNPVLPMHDIASIFPAEDNPTKDKLPSAQIYG